MPLYHIQGVVLQIFASDKPRLTVAFFLAANANAFALAQRVKAQAHMLANLLAFIVQNGPRCSRQVAIQKLTERAFANEANASAVFFGGVGQAQAQVQFFELRFSGFRPAETGFC